MQAVMPVIHSRQDQNERKAVQNMLDVLDPSLFMQRKSISNAKHSESFNKATQIPALCTCMHEAFQ